MPILPLPPCALALAPHIAPQTRKAGFAHEVHPTEGGGQKQGWILWLFMPSDHFRLHFHEK